MTYRVEQQAGGFKVVTDPVEGEFFDLFVFKKKGMRLGDIAPQERNAATPAKHGINVNVAEPDDETEALAQKIADLLNAQ